MLAEFADALAAAPATRGRGPVLLVTPSSIPASTATELQRLRPGRIVVLGGPRAISGDVVTELAAYTTGSVTRLDGIDRYATSAAIASTFTAPVPVVYLTTGAEFPDGVAAGATPAPVLLSRPSCVPTAVLAAIDRLDPDRIVLLGGTAALSPAVAALTPC